MSFLNLKKNKKVVAPEKIPVVAAPRKLAVSGEKKGAPSGAALFIERPRISEKVTFLAGANCYAFEVLRTANKRQVTQAVFARYKVTPRAVRMLTIPKKALFVRGKSGSTGGGKKAYVFLKKGDKIEL